MKCCSKTPAGLRSEQEVTTDQSLSSVQTARSSSTEREEELSGPLSLCVRPHLEMSDRLTLCRHNWEIIRACGGPLITDQCFAITDYLSHSYYSAEISHTTLRWSMVIVYINELNINCKPSVGTREVTRNHSGIQLKPELQPASRWNSLKFYCEGNQATCSV